MRKPRGGQIRANRLIGPRKVLAGGDRRVPAKGRGRTAPYRGRSAASWIWSTPLDASASEGERSEGVRPNGAPPRILGTISLFYRKEDRGKGRLRGRLQLFFFNPCVGISKSSLREFYLTLIILRIGPERSRARNAAKRTLDGEDRSGTIRGEGKEIRADRASEPVHLGQLLILEIVR